MINFDKKYIELFEGKIVFAPNGFGKTTISKKIKSELDKNGEEALLFTRRQMDNLLAINKTNFYFGESAKEKAENKNIKDELEKTTVVKAFAKQEYGVSSANALKENSFFFASNNVRNLKDISLIDIDTSTSLVSRSEKEAIELDKILKYDFYESIPDNAEKIKEVQKPKRKFQITEEIYDYLDQLAIFAKQEGLLACPLCGRNFSSNDKLIKSIDKKFKKYIVFDSNSPSDVINKIYNSLLFTYSKSNNSIIKSIFVPTIKNITFRDKIETIIKYRDLCDSNNAIIKNIVFRQEINGQTLGEKIDTIKRNEKIIQGAESSLSLKKKILDYVITEFKAITNLTDLEIKKNYEELSLFVAENKRNVPVYEYLSESECKRLSLAVLRAKIKYGKHKYLILDDPIDSYDDYYLSIVSTYIVNIVKERSLKGFYIFTNNNDALFRLSSRLMCDSIIFYENPDIVFGPDSNSFLYLLAKPKEIEFINKSEIHLLNIYLNTINSSDRSGITFDIDLSYVAFLPTIRNIKSDVIKKITRSKLYSGSIDNTSIFENRVKSNIEHCFMHYEPDLTKPLNSSNLKVSDVFDAFSMLINPKNPFIRSFSSDSSLLNDKRLYECSKPFSTQSGSEIIRLIFKKIIFVSQIKYDFECVLLNKLQNTYHFAKNDIDSIANTDFGFGSKVNVAMKIDKRSYCEIAKPFLEEVKRIHEKHSEFVNQFDHALSLMFPPYLSTRIYDIKKYKDDVDDLNRRF